MKKMWFLFIELIFLISSCKKADDNSFKEVAQTLTARAWVYTGNIIDDNNNGQPDESIEIADCAKDDSLVFRADHTATYNPTTVLFNDYRDSVFHYTWQLINAHEIQIVNTKTQTISNIKIFELTNERLLLQYSNSPSTFFFRIYQR